MFTKSRLTLLFDNCVLLGNLMRVFDFRIPRSSFVLNDGFGNSDSDDLKTKNLLVGIFRQKFGPGL